ncbi:MAG: zinc metalloprotease [Chitinophagaceae bacterium]
MRTVLLATLLLGSLRLFAQRECATHQYTEQQKVIDPTFTQKIIATEQFIQQHQTSVTARGADASANLSVIRVPVVVHVIYNNGSENISDAQIQSQIDVLNKDYRRLNADTANTPDRFKPFTADVQIEFALATADPNGRATTGIIRKYSSTRYWSMDDKIKYSSQGGDDAWDAKNYLNIWVSNTRNLLGYSSEPGCDPAKDGIVINYSAFGTISTVAPYHLGRTATHEVGHWLSLKHIWGDANCGDDLVYDTPSQSMYTSGCPTGVRVTCSNAPLGDMYMNYMDFTNDACMNLFTEGQKQRMRSLFAAGGPRYTLLTSKGLNQPWNKEAPIVEVKTPTIFISIFPNPATDQITLSLNESWIGKEVQIINMNGTLVAKQTVTNAIQKINLQRFAVGGYIIQGSNGDVLLRQKFIKMN